jgi:aerobic carbon-monoxide dehydrogenase medium subunit
LKPAPFTYHRPSSTQEAVAMLADNQDDASVLAGGQSLIPLMNFRVALPGHLVDINFLDELDYIRVDDGWLAIGARVRQSALERSDLVARTAPLLSEAIKWVAHPPVRHRGTIVGSIAHADPAAELPAAVRALDGELVLRRVQGERRVSAEDFFDRPLMTTIAPGELITEVRVPAAPTPAGQAVVEIARRNADFAVAGAAVSLWANGDQRAAVALFGVGPAPIRAEAAERLLSETASAPASEVRAAAVSELKPSGDIHGSSEYRRRLAGVCVERALVRAREGGS